jgi:type IV secretion system protein VirD4
MRPQPNRPPRHGIGETLALIFIGGWLAVNTMVWAALKVGGFIMTGHWPDLPYLDVSTAMLGKLTGQKSPTSRPVTLAHRPKIAVNFADSVFGGWLMPAIRFALVQAVIVLVAVAIISLRRWSRGTRRSRRQREAARWARLWDLRALAMIRGRDLRAWLVLPFRRSRWHAGREPRLVLGLGPWRRPLAVEALHSVFVLGPTQSRKTSGLAVPALLEWGGPAMATSVKPDLMADTIRRRRRMGTVWVFNPAGVPGISSDGWNPLSACTSWAKSRELAKWLAEAAAGTKRYSAEEAEFWDFAGTKLLGPVLWAAALGGYRIGQVVSWLDAMGEPPAEKQEFLNNTMNLIMSILGKHDEEAAQRAFLSVCYQDGRQRSGTVAKAQQIMEVFADTSVAAACSRPDIDPEELLSGANTLYLFAPLHEQNRLRPVFEALVMCVLRTAMEQSAAAGRALDPPLLALLDEAGNIAPLRELGQIASTGPGQGIQLVSVFHDFAQVQHRYGDQAHTVLNNHRAKVALSGLSDPASLEYFSRLIGDAAEVEESRTTGQDGRASRTEHVAYRHLAPLATLRLVRPGRGVLVYGHLPPAKLRLRYWRRNPTLCGLAAGGRDRRETSGAGAARAQVRGDLRQLRPGEAGRDRAGA